MIRLVDEQYGTEAWIAPENGNRVVRLAFGGHNVLHEPGIPFLAPWANRMPNGFHAGDQLYSMNRAIGNLLIDPATDMPIHGLLTECCDWEILQTGDSGLSTLLPFWRYPKMMAQWPFAHEYRLDFKMMDGSLETRVTVTNLCAKPMPVAVGFHPYFTIPGVPRAQWSVRLPARLRVVHDEQFLATGELVAAGLPACASLADYTFDSGFTGLSQPAEVRIEAGAKAIRIGFGPTWPVVIVWGPEGEDFLCVEPMAAVTDGINLHHRGLWPGLEWIQPNSEWSGVFTIGAEGFCDTERS